MSLVEDRLIRRFASLIPRLRDVTASEKFVSWKGKTMDPEALIDRWVAALDLGEFSAVGLSGVGDGTHVKALLKALPRGCFVFCIEPEIAVFRSFAESELGSELLEDSRVYFGTGELDDPCFESMGAFPVLEIQNALPLIFAPLFNENPDYYGEFFLQFARRIEMWRKLFGTNAVSSGLWQDNTLENLESLFGAPDISEASGLFQGKDMLLASAGPSLDESLDFLRDVQNQAVVVAVNSSFRALRNAGVDPHFVIAADPYRWTDKGFENVDLGRAILICPFMVFPKVVARFSGRIMTWSGNNLLASYLRLKLGLKLGSSVMEQGTVSACAFDLAEVLGCQSLTLLGQDLAVRTNGESHASDTFYSDGAGSKVNLDTCRWLPGNTIESVPVEEKLYVYLKTFEQIARQKESTFEVVNCARLGARIQGIPYVSIDEMSRRFAAKRNSEIETVWKQIRKMCEPKDYREDLSREIVAYHDYLKAACSFALRGGFAVESSSGPPNVTELKNVLAIRDQLSNLLESELDYFKVLQEGQLKFELLQFNREKRSLARIENAVEREYLELGSYFWAIAEATFRLMKGIENCRISFETPDFS